MHWLGLRYFVPRSATCCLYAANQRSRLQFLGDSVMHPPYVPAQAVKGEACTENKARKRSRCVHTLTVAIFSGIGLGSTASSTVEGGAAAGASSGGSVVPRTPRLLLAQDAESYASRLADTLAYIQRSALPSTAPSGLSRLPDKPPSRFVVSQTKCTCGGELLPGHDVDGTLVTEVRFWGWALCWSDFCECVS